MKILQLCNKVPFPPKDGGCIAMNNLTQGLIDQGCEVKVLAINTKKHFIDIDTLPSDYRSRTNVEAVFIDTEVNIISAVSNLFSSRSYNIDRFYSQAFSDKLIELLKRQTFDIIQLESLYVSMYVDIIRKYSKAKIVLRSQNVEYLIWERLAEGAANPLKKLYLQLLAKRLKKYELEMLNKYDGIATITDLDALSYKKSGCTSPMVHIPFGVDSAKYIADPSITQFPSVFHIGAMDWMPNADGIKWVLENVWGKVQNKQPNVKLYLAGRNMPDWMKQLNITNVLVEGEVEDSHKFINSKSIMIVPLSSGGGMRVKIIEGMALGKTIISTSVGAEGIAYENNKNIIIADTADEFVQAIVKCINDKTFAESIGNNAKALVEMKYDNQKICKNLVDFYQEIVNK